jgi:hypothetical protein
MWKALDLISTSEKKKKERKKKKKEKKKIWLEVCGSSGKTPAWQAHTP